MSDMLNRIFGARKIELDVPVPIGWPPGAVLIRQTGATELIGGGGAGSGEAASMGRGGGGSMVVVPPSPPPATPTPSPVTTRDSRELAEYALVASQIGLAVPELEVESFKHVLKKLDYPVYALAQVVPYMDAKAKAEGTGWGWCWRPLRAKDWLDGISFGTPADGGDFGVKARLASDFYFRGSTGMYAHTVPLHAIKKVAAIEKVFPGRVAFMVSDYATKPDALPDPFLMAVVPNADLHAGVGRFVIDFWDEPGFGMEQMLDLRK